MTPQSGATVASRCTGLPFPSPLHARSCSCWRAVQLASQPAPDCLQISCEAYREVVQKDPRFLKFFQQGTPVNELGRMNIGSRLAPCIRLHQEKLSSLVVCQARNLEPVCKPLGIGRWPHCVWGTPHLS